VQRVLVLVASKGQRSHQHHLHSVWRMAGNHRELRLIGRSCQVTHAEDGLLCRCVFAVEQFSACFRC
jgi:hypothetical protein